MVQLVWTSTCCPGLKPLQGGPPAWLKDSYEKIVEIGAAYGKCILCQMDCCGTPIIPSEWADESKNAPLQEMRSKFPQYTFTFRPQWVGRGKHASWNHILQITNTPTAVVGQVVGAPGQQNM